MACALIGSSACSRPKPEAAGENNAAAPPKRAAGAPSPAAGAARTAAEAVPPSLADAGDYAENIYDYARAKDWKDAEAKLVLLKAAVKQLRTVITTESPEVDRIDKDVATLDPAVTARDQRAATRAANQVTRDVAELSATYKLPVPVEVTRLDYYGRELEIWAETGNGDKLNATAKAMRHDWDALRPAVEARNHAEAEKFGALVAQVEKAGTPADFARLAKPVLDEVD
ncbi:MAG TPA: hypothetical protein VIY96_09780, partial [Thermoanaerobaculia bacterium]